MKLGKRTLRGKTSPARGLVSTLNSATISLDGGERGAGLIRGASIITRGPALGHGMFVDATFVEQTTAAINAAGGRGVKSRFTHPDVSNDGLGKYLGRTRGATTIEGGNRSIGDLHLSPAARQTPSGDLAAYVLNLAADDPEAFGTSIVFLHDRQAEASFVEQHGGRVHDLGGGFLDFDLRDFRSPDETNVDNLFHARLAAIKAVDVVDEPAANPAGMFSADPIFNDADAILSFALGLVDQAPELERLELDPRKVSVFFSRFLDRHDLAIAPKGKGASMPKLNEQKPADDQPNSGKPAEQAPAAETPAAETPADGAGGCDCGKQKQTAAGSKRTPASLDELTAACKGADADFLIGQLRKGATVTEAQSAYIAEQGAAIEKLNAKNEHLAGSESSGAQFGAEGERTAPRRSERNAKLAAMIRVRA